MTRTQHEPVPGWDAEGYDSRFDYVSALGRGLVELLGARREERVLDLGCGTGALAAEIARGGTIVWGLDADPAMVERAKAEHPHLVFVLADGHGFEFEEPFDAVFSNAALHWMPRAGEVAACVFRALRPGGRFVAEFGGKGNVAAIVGAVRSAARECDVGEEAVVSPWYFPSPGEYVTVLEEAGFVVRQLEYFDRPTPLDDCPDGVADWLRMFGGALLAGVDPSRREEVVRRAAELAAPMLRKGDRWFADYRRLRFLAERPETDVTESPRLLSPVFHGREERE